MMNLTAAIDYHARVIPSRVALAFGETNITYRELSDRASQVAAYLHEREVGKGDVVALRMKNSPACYDLVLGCSRIGAIVLPINFRLSGEETNYIIENSGAKLLFVDEELAGDVSSFPAIVKLDEVAHRDLSAMGICRRAIPSVVPTEADDIFRLMYTSGTTSRPKGVIHNYLNGHCKSLDHIGALGLSSETRLLVAGPFYHIGGFDAPGFSVLRLGGYIRLLRDFDPNSVLDLISTDNITGTWLAPSMLNSVIEAGPQGRDLNALQWCLGGGERTPESRVKTFNELFPKARYVDAYGLTETYGFDTMMEPGREIEKIGSAGRPVMHVEFRVADDEGRTLPSNQDGEVCIRGPSVTSGYWRDAEKTKSSFFPDGWFRTGDIGHVDDDGFLFLTDRKKDMIISGGENIASAEVERVIYNLPEISEVAVIGVPDQRWGERPVAIAVLKPGSTLNYATLVKHCQKHLAKFKVPDQLIFRELLPRNPSGKVLKRLLREEFENLS